MKHPKVGNYKQQKCIFYTSRGWGVPDQASGCCARWDGTENLATSIDLSYEGSNSIPGRNPHVLIISWSSTPLASITLSQFPALKFGEHEHRNQGTGPDLPLTDSWSCDLFSAHTTCPTIALGKETPISLLRMPSDVVAYLLLELLSRFFTFHLHEFAF